MIIKRSILKSLFACLVFLFPVVCFAQINAAPGSDFICEDPNSSMLWKVKNNNNGGASQLYLFGSLHVGKANFYPLPAVIETAFQNADHLVFEVDPATAEDPALALQIQTRGMLPAGQSLLDVVSPEVIANLERVVTEMGMSTDNFIRMQPWFLTLVLSTLQINSLGYTPDFGIESYLLGTKPQTTDVLELETIQEQMALLEELNSESYLDYALQGFEEEGLDEIEAMMLAWQCADRETLSRLLFDDSVEEPGLSPEMKLQMDDFEEKLIFERNITMAAGVREYLESGSGQYFVVVGSGHLLGERSVIDILRNEGYQIDSVRLQP